MFRLLSGGAAALIGVALVAPRVPQDALRVIHEGSKEARPTGVLVRGEPPKFLDVYGRRGRLVAWDLEQGGPAPPDAALDPITLERHQELVFAALDEMPLRTTWLEPQEPGQQPLSLEGSAGTGKTITLDEVPALAVTVSGDGTTAAAYPATPHAEEPPLLFLADLEENVILGRVPLASISLVALSHTGERVLVRAGGEVLVLDRQGRRLHSLGPAREAWISRGGNLTAVRRDGGVDFFEGDRRLAAVPADPRASCDVAFADGARIVAVASAAKVSVVELDSGLELQALRAPEAGARFHSVDLSPDGERIAAGGISVPERERGQRPARAFVMHAGRGRGAPRTEWLAVDRWSVLTPTVSFLPGRPEVLVELPFVVALFDPRS